VKRGFHSFLLTQKKIYAKFLTNEGIHAWRFPPFLSPGSLHFFLFKLQSYLCGKRSAFPPAPESTATTVSTNGPPAPERKSEVRARPSVSKTYKKCSCEVNGRAYLKRIFSEKKYGLEHFTVFCSRLHRGVIGSYARAIFSQDTPMVEIGQWLEPHGLLHQKLPGEHMATAFCYML